MWLREVMCGLNYNFYSEVMCGCCAITIISEVM